jgi:hypothetical protein
MARISTYALDNNINDEDKLVGTDADDNNITKNFTLEGVAEYVIDTLIDPNAIQAYIPVFRNTDNTDSGNATRITGSIIKQNSYPTGSLITIAGDLTLERDQSDTTLTLISDGSNQGENNNPSIKFIQDGGAQNAAVGFNIIDDTGGGTIPGTGNRFWIVNAMDDTVGSGGITFGTAQVDGWENAIGRFIIRGDGKGLFGHPDSLYTKALGSQFEIYDNRDENTTTDPSFSVYSVVDFAAPSGNEGAGGIKQILDVYDNGVFQQQEAIMLIPGSNSSDLATSTPLAFYTNSNMDTASPSGFAGMIFDSGNWLLDGSGTFTTADPGYQLKVAGTGLFTGQVTIPETPVAGTDAASKAYVDSQNFGQVSGTGTTNVLPIWSDGPNSVLSDSIITQVGTSSVTISGNINGQGVIEGESLTIHTGPSTITGELDKDGSKITNLADPTAGQDAATKAYVDSQSSGIAQTTGTYTPQLIAGVPSEWVISSYNFQQGKWVRTGNMVFCDFWIIINASNISGNTGGTSGLSIQGWPYDHDGGAASFQGGALNQCDGFDVQSAGTNTTLNSGLGNAKLNILKQNAPITNYFVTVHMKTGDLNNGNQIYIIGSFSYLTTDAATLNPGATIDS